MNVKLESNKIVLAPETTSATTTARRVYMAPGIHEARVVEFRDWNEAEIKYATEQVQKAKMAGRDKELVPFIVMAIEDESTGARHEERFYLGKQSHKYSKAKIGHIVAVLCPGCDLSQMNDTTIIADGIVGKMGRFKINGEEAISKKGKVYPRAKSFPAVRIWDGVVHGFCERLEQPTQLTFDMNNPHDFKRLNNPAPSNNVPVATEEAPAPPADPSDLPF